jgi:sulfite reductase alpha subunit-like flavoprotein
MAADVQRELQAIVETASGRTAEQATEYVSELRRTRRLKLDVY